MAQADVKTVSQLDVEPGELPSTMTAWVIRQDREGEPKDAFQIEDIEVPEPGAFEVIVRVMAAGVNFNNVWAALGQPVSVFRYHPDEDHHIGGSDASGVVWKVGEGVTRWKPGDEVVIHCNQASYEDVEVHGLDPLAAPSQKIWGYETSWGSFAQFTKVQAQQLVPKPKNLTWEEAASYGLTYFTAYRMLIDQVKLQAGHRVLIWGAAGGLGVFATQLCKITGADSVGVVSSDEKGELVKQLGAKDFINRNEFAGMMRKGGESKDEEKERFGQSRALRQAGQGDPRRRARHRVRACRPGHIPHLGVRREAVREGRDLRRHLGLQPGLRRALPLDAPEADHRVALRQRLGGDQGQRADRPVQDPSRAVARDAVRGRRRGAPADAREQAPGQDRDPGGRREGRSRQDRRGARRDPRRGRQLRWRSRRSRSGHGRARRSAAMIEMVQIDFHLTPFRAQRFYDLYRPVVPRVMAYGAKGYSFYRSEEDADHFVHSSLWEDRADFRRFWDSREMHLARERILGLYEQPVIPGWATILDRG